MAFSKVPAIAQAVIDRCTLCDRGTDARFFCTDCNEDMCKQCKTTHLQSKATRNHNVISTADDKDTSTHDVKINCIIHPEEYVVMCCTKCEVLVCPTCIIAKHQNHTLDKLAHVIDKYKKKISGHVNDIKQDIQGLKSNLQSLEGNKKAYIKDTDDVTDKINKKLEEWKTQAYKIAHGLIQQVQDYKSHDLQQIDKQCKQIQDLIVEKENALKSYEGINQTGDADSIIKCATNIQKTDKANPEPIYAISPQFATEGLVDLTEIFGHLKIEKGTAPKSTSKQQDVNRMRKKSSQFADNFGRSPNIDTTVVSEFKLKQTSSVISVTGNKQAWLEGGISGKNVTLVDIHGNVLKNLQLDIKLYDIKATTQGELFITEENGHQIKKYNTDGKCVSIANMSPLYTRGLCITSDDDLLVCLSSCDDDDDDDDDDDKVVRMTMNGQVKQTIQYDQHKQPLYSNPRLVTENINGDVCVVDNAYPSRVVVVNKDGVLKFRYPGTTKSSYTISDCSGIACDTLGYILIGDSDNHKIHQIDIDGKFVQYILTEQHGIQSPWGLDIDTEGKLWICNDIGNKVTIVKYRS